VEDCPTNKPTPKNKKKKKACKTKALTTIKTWDDSSSEDEAQHKRHARKHSSSSTSQVLLEQYETFANLMLSYQEKLSKLRLVQAQSMMSNL
jgi:hypothetical protein